MGTQMNNKNDRNTPEYLAQLLKDKKQIQAFPNVFLHAERLLDEEISKVRVALFHVNGTHRDLMVLPEAQGPVVTLSEKLYVPVKEHPDFNFVGRILGPRGMTAKQLEQDTGCKIMVRGKGSMRDKVKEEQNKGKPNWEHLNEDLHVLITVEDTKSRAEVKISRAVSEVEKLLVPAPEGEDDLKKRQLMELAIINGTYRDTKTVPNATSTMTTTQSGNNWLLQQTLGDSGLMYYSTTASVAQEAPRLVAPPMSMPPALRSPTPAGAPLILAPRVPNLPASAGLFNGVPPPLMSPTEAGLLYSPYEYPYAMAHSAGLLEYPSPIESSAAGAVAKVRRTMGMREHPYPRVSLT